MKDWDDDICKAVAHQIRRRIIECLQERDALSFRELLKYVGIGNHGKLGFHIKALGGLVEREPSMKKYRLTDRGQLASELIWDIRFIIARGGRDLTHEPTRYFRHLRFGDHAILHYDTEDVKREITFPFLEAGLPKGEAVVYVVSEHKLDSEAREILRYGISGDYLRNGAFTIMRARAQAVARARNRNVWGFTPRTAIRIVKRAMGKKYYPHFLRLNRATRFLEDPSTTLPEMLAWFGWKDIRTVSDYVGYSKRTIAKQRDRLGKEVLT